MAQQSQELHTMERHLTPGQEVDGDASSAKQPKITVPKVMEEFLYYCHQHNCGVKIRDDGHQCCTAYASCTKTDFYDPKGLWPM